MNLKKKKKIGIPSLRNSDAIVSHANGLLAKSVSKLEEEFKQPLASYRLHTLLQKSLHFLYGNSKPVEPDHLFEGLPNSLRPSSKDQAEPGHKTHHDLESRNLESVVYTPPVLIPPRILPLLHNLATQMFQAWHHQQLLKIYRKLEMV